MYSEQTGPGTGQKTVRYTVRRMKQIDYGHGSIFRAMILSAGPMMAAQVLSLLYNIVDRMYIARIPQTGTLALGSIGLCFPILTILTAFASLYGSGGGPLSAIACGRGDLKEARTIQNTSFALIVLTGLALMAIGELFCLPILQAFGATPGNIGYATGYLRIVLLGTVFSMLASGMNPFLNAQGFPAAGMMTVLIGAVLNIILDPVFIFVFGWGIEGAAWATVLSQIVSALFIFWFLLRKKAVLKLEPLGCFRSIRLNRIKRITSLGFAGFIMQITNSLVQSVSNTILGQTGGDLYISVMTIVSSVRQILDTPIFGLTDGTSPIISFNYGAGKPDRVRSTIRLMTLISIAYTCIIWLLILLHPQFFISLFNDDASLTRLAIPALKAYFFAFLFQAFQYSGQTVFKSLGKRKQAIFFSLFRKVILVVPLTFLLPHYFGVMGVFQAEPTSNFVGGSACFLTMLATVGKDLKKAVVKQDSTVKAE